MNCSDSTAATAKRCHLLSEMLVLVLPTRWALEGSKASVAATDELCPLLVEVELPT